MTTRDAIAFIAAVRDDATLAARIDALGPDATLEAVVAIAAEAGFRFTADELRTAHRNDWGLRWARLVASPRERPPD